ncbi:MULTISPECIES: hypothetical protein [Vibrio]|uniref:Uncharacterized protein n=1 Tax=Vibrio kanaloae TaxID=170673 RepID=A0ABV4LJP2_9VIBR|nr:MULTISPECIES: hypothetical protein [Vibrio]MCG9564617.1 hypothetical protein [Vibrio chagasii]OEE18275.1 hypothetical protein OAY_10115 [Vibrio cyclitrophicus ZF205]OEF16221.1 hypothetical protein A132_00725 [Vibrio kanaloae 5S-149]
MRAKRAGRVPGARALAGTANKNYPHQRMYQVYEGSERMETRRLCFDTLANSPALPVFWGKADK